MSVFLLDTHAWAWSLSGDHRLSAKAITLIENADRILVGPISLFEIGQKVRIGKWPAMEPFVEQLPDILQQQGGETATLTPAVCLAAATMPWDHRDPFDRLLAATAAENHIALISADLAFDSLHDLDGWIARLW